MNSHLVVGGQLHGRHLVDVLLELVEQVVPPPDDPALVLVVDQVQLVRVPRLLDLSRDGECW